MAHSFRHAYARLTGFVSKHPEIEIGESVTCIPENVRPQFYRLFNTARVAYVREKFPGRLADARALQENYNAAVAETAQWLSLEDPPHVSALQRYLRNPEDSMARELFDPLFDLLKGKESIDSFEKRISLGTEEIFPALFRDGYEKWAVVSLLSLLEADKAFRVSTRNLNSGERVKAPLQAPSEEIPVPQESTRFCFTQPQDAVFAVPDFIIHSSKLNRFVGIRSDFRKAFYNALNTSRQREWRPVNHELLAVLSRGLTLIYIAENSESLALVADVAKFSRPDLVLWCIDARKLGRDEALHAILNAQRHLNPTRGSFLVVNELWPEAGDSRAPALQPPRDGRAAGVRLLRAGFDKTKLAPVIEALAGEKAPAIPA